MLFYVASGFSGKAAALPQDCQRIRRTEFHVIIPIVPVEGLVSFDFPVLVREPKEIVRDAVQDDVLNNLKRVSEYGIMVVAGKVIVRYRRRQLSKAEADNRSREETQKRIAELQDFIGSRQTEITEFDESLVRKLIQQITVYDDHFSVRFKSELEVNINE